MAQGIVVQFTIDEKGAVKNLRTINKELHNTEKAGGQAEKGIGGLVTGMKALVGIELTRFLASGIRGLTSLAKWALNSSSGFERMQISLDTITKGRGLEWFNKLNEWALKMPVNTEKAIQSFTMLKAMGLDPTIKDMTILVDTASALGGQAGALEGLARALGQIVTKGKVSAEELMQLAERGIPAYEILREKLNLTANQVANIGNEAINGQKAVDALLEGMNEKFGGQAAKIDKTYGGIIEGISSNWKEFMRLMMDTGPFSFVKGQLESVRKKMEDIVGGMKGQSLAAKWLPNESRAGQSNRSGWGDFGGYSPSDAVYSAEQIARAREMEAALQKVNEANEALYETNRKNNKVVEDTIKNYSTFYNQISTLGLSGAAGGYPSLNGKKFNSKLGAGAFGVSAEKEREIDEGILEQYKEYQDQMSQLNIRGEELRYQVQQENAQKDIALMERRAESFGRIWGDLMTDMVFDSKINFESILDAFKRMLVRMQLEKMATEISMKFLGGGGLGSEKSSAFETGIQTGFSFIKTIGSFLTGGAGTGSELNPVTNYKMVPNKSNVNNNSIGSLSVNVYPQGGELDPQQVADAIEKAVRLRKMKVA